ncbi:MAG TPA: hypothetical protein VFF67_01420 [Thermoplasmata archaeon]|nr:hypothetical protein [Thermoplasmata archaeon]
MPGSPSSAERAAAPGGPIAEAKLAAIEAHLHQREARRDDLFQRARKLRRLSQATMLRLHEAKASEAEIASIRTGITELTEFSRRAGRADEGLAMDAFQEAVEASLLAAVVAGRELPGPTDLGVEPEPYLLGLGDLVGEVRRLALDHLASGDLANADAALTLMDRLVRVLMRFDTTRSIVALKPKQDVARALLEKTRGDVTMAHVFRGGSPPPPLRREGEA